MSTVVTPSSSYSSLKKYIQYMTKGSDTQIVCTVYTYTHTHTHYAYNVFINNDAIIANLSCNSLIMYTEMSTIIIGTCIHCKWIFREKRKYNALFRLDFMQLNGVVNCTCSFEFHRIVVQNH